MNVECTIEIEQPINEVFEVITCRRRCVVWMNTFNSQMESDGPTRVGSTFTGEYHLLGKTYPFKAIITEFNPPTTYAYKTIEGPDSTTLYTLTPTESGTRLRMICEAEKLPASIQSVLNNRLAKQTIEKAFKAELEQLKVLMESNIDLWALTPA